MLTLKKNNPPNSILKFSIFIFLLHVSMISAEAQKKSSSKSSGGSFPYQWGVGVKVGSPTGITVKKYMDNKALELIFGYPYYYGSYYGHRFRNDRNYKNYSFTNPYGYSNRASLQLRYLIHHDLSDVQGLRWYIGAGGQLRSVSYFYDYRDQNGNYYTGRARSINFGVDGVAGLEYTFPDAPISIFADLNLYMEIIRVPFYLEGQGGIGIRYNIK